MVNLVVNLFSVLYRYGQKVFLINVSVADERSRLWLVFSKLSTFMYVPITVPLNRPEFDTTGSAVQSARQIYLSHFSSSNPILFANGNLKDMTLLFHKKNSNQRYLNGLMNYGLFKTRSLD